MPPCGITYSIKIDDYLYVARSNILEIYTYDDKSYKLNFITSHTFVNRILYVDCYNGNYIIGFS